jgi:hypothetical protein
MHIFLKINPSIKPRTLRTLLLKRSLRRVTRKRVLEPIEMKRIGLKMRQVRIRDILDKTVDHGYSIGDTFVNESIRDRKKLKSPLYKLSCSVDFSNISPVKIKLSNSIALKGKGRYLE